jgi:hypothetical protein
MRIRFSLVSLLWIVLAAVAGAAPVDFSAPSGSFGNSDREGGLTYSLDLQEADFGDGVKLPVRFTFQSRARGFSSYGWTGWTCGILQSNVKLSQLGSSGATIKLPCTKKMYMSIIGGPTNGKYVFQTQDEEWNGEFGVTQLIGPGTATFQAVKAGTLTRWGWVVDDFRF